MHALKKCPSVKTTLTNDPDKGKRTTRKRENPPPPKKRTNAYKFSQDNQRVDRKFNFFCSKPNLPKVERLHYFGGRAYQSATKKQHKNLASWFPSLSIESSSSRIGGENSGLAWCRRSLFGFGIGRHWWVFPPKDVRSRGHCRRYFQVLPSLTPE